MRTVSACDGGARAEGRETFYAADILGRGGAGERCNGSGSAEAEPLIRPQLGEGPCAPGRAVLCCAGLLWREVLFWYVCVL